MSGSEEYLSFLARRNSQTERTPMKESTIQILLAEYDRLKGMEQFWQERHEHTLQFYLTVITAGGGAILFLIEKQVAPSLLVDIVGLILGMVLLIGEIAFLRMMGLDIRSIQNARGYLLIRDKFLSEDPELANAFLKGLAQNPDRHHSVWSLIGRAFTSSQHKTTIVFMNCLVSAGIVDVTMGVWTIWTSLAVGIVVAILVGLLHVVYASWRYKRAARAWSRDETGAWV
jgi:Flp pilus assembly protein TadB